MIAILLAALLSGCVTRREAPLPVVVTDVFFCADPKGAFFEPYTVKSGDTLWSIARRFRNRDTLDEIIRRNDITAPDRISQGQIIYIQYPRKKQPEDAQHPPGP